MFNPAARHAAPESVKFAVELAPDAMFRVSSRGRIVYANRAAHELLAYGPAELSKLEIFDIANLTTRRQWPERCRHLQLVGARVYETNFRTKQGKSIPVDVAASHQVYDGEDFAEIVARDISAKRALEARVLEIQDRERARIGQDLHDDIGQRLTAIALALDNLERDPDASRAAASDRIKDLAVYTRETLEHVRDLSLGLLPIAHDSIGLRGALEQLAGSLVDSLSVDCTLDFEREVSLKSSYVISNVYRIVQEAISNAVRHGSAKRVTIECSVQGGWVTLKIVDDGSGMEQTSGPGLGMRIMDYRARSIGGELEVLANETGGATVQLRVPTESIAPAVTPS